MAFPRRLLTDGEELVLDLRPHWIALAGPVAAGVAIVAVWLVLARYLSHHFDLPTDLYWIVAAVAVVGLLRFTARGIVRWATSHFVVTSDRVIHRSGLIAKRSMEMPLEALNNVKFEQGMFERMIGAGTLILESAAEQGNSVFSDIRNPEEVQKTIYHLGELNQQRMMRGGPAAQAAPSVATELQRLADLRDRGVLTEEEFQAQKRKMLGGPSN